MANYCGSATLVTIYGKDKKCAYYGRDDSGNKDGVEVVFRGC